MVRRWAVTFTALTLLAPAGAHALGLGDINVRSGLNQALHAEIELLAVRPGELDSLSVGLASNEAFAQAGVERPFLLTQLRFKVEQHADGTPYIKVYTQEPIKEPYLNYLVEVNWSAGHLLREYTVLLDPPTLMAAPAPVIEAPAAQSSAPDSAPATGADDAAPASTNAPDASATSDEYGPIRPGQGLWGVATRLRPDESVSVQQMMLALLEANPDAFLDPDNVNTLKADHMLRVPGPDEMNALTPEQAIAVIKKHNAQWYKLHPAPAQTATPVTAPAPPAAADASAPPEAVPEDGATGGKLKLVVPTEGQTPDAAPQAGTGADAEQANEALALANEELESKRQENDELRERVAELEKQTADIQRLMMLKNEELAALQGKLTASPSAAQPASPAATAPTPAQSPAVSELNTGTLDQARAVARDVAEAIRSNPLAQGVAALVALLVLSLLWVVNRRRRVNAELIEESDVSAMPLAVVPVAAAGANTHAAPAHETDLLAEADVFMAYERYPEAEARLRQLLAQQPARADAHLKLLEIYHVTHDKSAFVAQAEALHRLVEGSGPEWTKAAWLGTELCPEHHLFRADSDRTVTPNEAAAFTASAVAPAVSEPAPSLPDAVEFTPTAQDKPPLEFTPRESIQADQPASALDLGALDYPSSAPSAPAASNEPQESAQALALEDDLADFNLADIQSELEAGLAQQTADAPATAGNGLDFTPEFHLEETDRQEPAGTAKLDFDLEHEAGILADQAPETLHSPPALDDMLDLDASFLTNTDEVGTKLDLARAYIEMGDQEGAHSILDEVMKEGNEGQRQQAQELMVQVG